MNSILLRISFSNKQEYPGIDSWQYSEAKNSKSYQTGGSGNQRIGLLGPGRFSTAGKRWRASGLSLWWPCCHQLKKHSGESRMSLKPGTWCVSLHIKLEGNQESCNFMPSQTLNTVDWEINTMILISPSLQLIPFLQKIKPIVYAISFL